MSIKTFKGFDKDMKCRGFMYEEVVDLVQFKGIIPHKDKVDSQGRYWHTVDLVFVSKQRNYKGNLIECERKEEFGLEDHWQVQFRNKAVRPGYSDKFKNFTFEQQIDDIIKWDLTRSLDHIIKDNSSIPIYI